MSAPHASFSSPSGNSPSGPDFGSSVGIPFTDALERIRQQLDIVDIVGRVVPLKRSGRNYTGLCPFHNDKNPSFSVNREKNLYKCFSCGEGGDAFSFIMKQQNKTFGEVIHDLADEMGIIIAQGHKAPEQIAEEKNQRSTLFQLNEAAGQWFQQQLASPAGETIRQYLAKRDVSPEWVAHFGLGYAPPGWENLTQHLCQTLPHLSPNPKAVAENGLATERPAENGKPSRVYDRFRDRLMIPIHDEQGRLVAFGGRAFDEHGPKYLNSPETPIYHKSRLLYGLHWAGATIRQTGQAVVMEGYFDVMAAHQADICQAVAVCGVALTEQHIRLLIRHGARQVVLCLDADEAGQRATQQSLELLRAFQDELTPYVVVIPDGKDPADYRQQHGDEALQALFADGSPHKQDALAYRIQGTLSQHNLASPLGKADAVQALAPILGQVTNPVRFRHYASLVAQQLGIVAEDVMQACRTHRPVAQASFTRTRRPVAATPPPKTALASSDASAPNQALMRLEQNWFALLFMNTDSYNVMLPRLANMSFFTPQAQWCQQQLIQAVTHGHTTLEASMAAIQALLDAERAESSHPDSSLNAATDSPTGLNATHHLFWSQCLFEAGPLAEEWSALIPDRPLFMKRLNQHLQRLETRLNHARQLQQLAPMVNQAQSLESRPMEQTPTDDISQSAATTASESLRDVQQRFLQALQPQSSSGSVPISDTNLPEIGNSDFSSPLPIPQG